MKKTLSLSTSFENHTQNRSSRFPVLPVFKHTRRIICIYTLQIYIHTYEDDGVLCRWLKKKPLGSTTILYKRRCHCHSLSLAYPLPSAAPLLPAAVSRRCRSASASRDRSASACVLAGGRRAPPSAARMPCSRSLSAR